MDDQVPTSPLPATVLLLDSDAQARTAAEQMLQHLGHAVVVATSLAEAREMLRQSPVDLVLAAMDLSAESGLDLLHELAPRSPEVAVVMMTQSPDPRTSMHCLRSGAFDYLLKPFTLNDLNQVLARVLERQRAMQAHRRGIEEPLRILSQFPSENPNPVLRVANDGTLLDANRASVAFLHALRARIGDPLPDFFGDMIASALNQDLIRDVELESAGRSYSLAVTPIKNADYVYVYCHPISSLKETARQLARLKIQAQAQALHDVLTGLPNRTLLMDRFEQAIAHSRRNQRKLVVVFVDLDNFKQINDTRGHEVGDQVLIAVANRLSQAVRKSDTVARWGGDEMILLLPSIREQNIRTVCERLKDHVQKQLAKEDGFFVTMSMGAAIFPDDDEDPEQLLQSADAALLLAKNRARNEVIFFGEFEELKSFRQKTHIRALLTSAVTEQRIQVHFQPIVETKTGRTVGAEALARWHEEGHGWLSPGMFIPMAENMGLIEDLSRQVIEQALRHLERCHRQGYSLPLSINLSLRQLLRADFTKDMLELTQQFDLKPEQLILEMTESQALLGLDSEARQMEQLSSSGFSLSIDDFGQGYSSLASLHEMPVRELKIDMKFMRNLHTKKGRRIVKTIVGLSRTLGLETVAEGVETQEQWTILKELGVQRLQGHLFSHPLPAEEFMVFLHSQTQTLPSL